MKEMIFSSLNLDVFDHLIGNHGMKVWANRTAETVTVWEDGMACPLTNTGLAGCNCPISSWHDKKLFIAHWQLYHIDHVASRICCSVRTSVGDRCSYWTDRRKDMFDHVSKTHSKELEQLKSSGIYEDCYAWLDLCTYWMMKGIDKVDKTAPEILLNGKYTIGC